MIGRSTATDSEVRGRSVQHKKDDVVVRLKVFEQVGRICVSVKVAVQVQRLAASIYGFQNSTGMLGEAISKQATRYYC
jgi:hypothetical protein